ncbi:hypothetical protein [Neobacillus drentensis]|uniref:hypothetical protein n=1 Tax=Neobacillus drentensis TaxID=220684 RepID=UPI002FFEDD02
MSNLDFLEISRNFKSYYRTLRDVHFYLTNDPELSKEELQAVTKVLSKLIYGFISIKGTSFREMEREQFEQEFNLFHQDFLQVIQNSGENNVSFDDFTSLIDEIIAIAVKRTNTLGKIKKGNQELLFEEAEVAEVTADESGFSNEEEDNSTVDELVVDVDVETTDEEETIPEEKSLSAVVRTFSTDFGALGMRLETEAAINADVELQSTENEDVSEDEQLEPGNEVVVPEVVNEVKVQTDKPANAKNNYVDAAPVVNKYDDTESDDRFRFRPRRRNNR